ncbi:MAG: NADH-quinone oxidoreductase subunit H [Candidatus Eisenbacteria bacterium]|nr:NADH-quinone oxidoreductase subunit H [Candidatus Eisenbacteria bacterium]
MNGNALDLAILVLVPPLLPAVIARTKAFFAGRRGQPLLQPYRDILRLLRKDAVYSRTTTWVFRAGPLVSCATALAAGAVLPLSASRHAGGFSGDIVVFAYLLGLGRFFTMAAALDTGSSFEGMGASREAAFSSLAEPALFVALAILAINARALSFAGTFGALTWSMWGWNAPVLLVACLAIGVVLLAENARIPIDDPNTHLELTMVHEVMVLDHGSVDLALVQYGSAVRLFVFGALFLHTVLPHLEVSHSTGAAILLAGELAVAVMVGVVESVMARLRLPRVPQVLAGAGLLAAIGLIIQLARSAR